MLAKFGISPVQHQLNGGETRLRATQSLFLGTVFKVPQTSSYHTGLGVVSKGQYLYKKGWMKGVKLQNGFKTAIFQENDILEKKSLVEYTLSYKLCLLSLQHTAEHSAGL